MSDILSGGISRFKSSYVSPVFDARASIKDIREDTCVIVNLSRLGQGDPVETSVEVKPDPPFTVHPQRDLLLLESTGEVLFTVTAPGALNPGTYGFRVEAEAGGYRCVQRIFHKIPMVCNMFRVLPKVDGSLGDWGVSKFAPLVDEEGLPAGKVMAGWNRDWLFIGVQVDGAGVGRDEIGEDLGSADGLRLGIDTLWDQRQEGYAFDDLELIAGLTREGPLIAASPAQPNPLPMKAVLVAIARSHEGLVYEIALSPAEEAVWKLETKSIIGVSLAVKATDSATGEPLRCAWGQGLTEERSPMLFNVVGLGGMK